MITEEQFKYWSDKISSGDKSAFTELFNDTYTMFVNFSYRYVKSKSTATDIVQDAFIKLWNNRDKLDSEKSLKSFLFTIVRNLSLNHIRDSHLTYIPGDELRRSFNTDLDDEPDIWDEVEQKLPQWIENLPDRQQEIFELSRYEGLTHKEIAAVLDISPRTVNNHINNALETLRECLKDLKKQKI